MNKSYKRTPILEDTYGSKTKKWSKRQAAKVHINNMAKGSVFKKLYCSCDIIKYVYKKVLQI